MGFIFSSSFVLALALWLALLLALETGQNIGVRRLAADPGGSKAGIGAVEASLFGLLGLLLAFTFSGAGARFDDRRDLIIQEANAIGTAYLRIDLLPAQAQPALRQSFRDYVDARLDIYRHMADPAAQQAAIERASRIQGDIWKTSVAAATGEPPSTMSLLVPALNDMFDITTTRFASTRIHPPAVIFIMLVVLELAAALLAGYAMAGGSRNWMHRLVFATILTLATYVIIDMEYPRMGFVRVNAFDQLLVDVRASMK